VCGTKEAVDNISGFSSAALGRNFAYHSTKWSIYGRRRRFVDELAKTSRYDITQEQAKQTSHHTTITIHSLDSLSGDLYFHYIRVEKAREQSSA